MLSAIARRLLRRFDRVSLRIWMRRLELTRQAEVTRLPGLAKKAQPLRALTDQVIRAATFRRAAAGAPRYKTAFPPRTDWAWRPDILSPPEKATDGTEPGSPVTPDLRLYHDAENPLIGLSRDWRRPDRPALAADIYEFDGTYFSLAVALPSAALSGLERTHLFRLDLDVSIEAPGGLSARLNLRHGPNTERIVRSFDLARGETSVEFDVAYTGFDPSRGTELWIDIIFSGVRMNRIEIRDILVLRRSRADI